MRVLNALQGNLWAGAFDLRVAFFAPVWRRALLAAVCVIRCVAEFRMSDPVWGGVAGVFGAIIIWHFFMRAWPETAKNPNDRVD